MFWHWLHTQNNSKWDFLFNYSGQKDNEIGVTSWVNKHHPSCTTSRTHTHTHICTHSLTNSLTHLWIHVYTQKHTVSLTHSLTHWTKVVIKQQIFLLTHSLTHSLTRSILVWPTYTIYRALPWRLTTSSSFDQMLATLSSSIVYYIIHFQPTSCY